jgi:tRNA-2-methylthio-N6-dimethylallyladenosine synthase
MRRDYTVEHYSQLIGEMRNRIPDLALSTDIIVGFPGESEAQFRNTFDLLAEIKFDTVHVAAYSPRPGTIAARKMEDNVPLEEKRMRLSEIERLQEITSSEINSRLSGKSVEILVEGKEKRKWQGRTRTGKLVFFASNEDCTGQLVNISIEKTSPWSLQGSIESVQN